ncbi:hypothetical protein [Putridiphycobacter roseus]|uniref:hypothetical protein n=1 Tax=Putridiphycobacter roseus TaxID=2219161 RepID=UPI00363F02A4
MVASTPSSSNEETVSEDRAESADGNDWEEVGRELLRNRLQDTELRLQEAISEISIKVKTGEDLSRLDFTDLHNARDDLDELLGILDELTEPFVFERENEIEEDGE